MQQIHKNEDNKAALQRVTSKFNILYIEDFHR